MNELVDEVKKKKVLIVIPSLDASGPAKGSIALANLLSSKYEIKLVSLKINKLDNLESKNLNSSVDLYLINKTSYLSGLLNIFLFFIQEKKDVMISFCLVPDLINLVFGNHLKILSFRTNHSSGYNDIYGKIGYLMSLFHNLLPIFSNHTVVMSKEHAKKLPKISKKKCKVIKNFLDPNISYASTKNNNNSGRINMIIVSGLTKRKNIHKALKILDIFFDKIDSIHIFGEGPERNRLEKISENIKIKVKFYGKVLDPWEKIPNNPFFIHLSSDEGFPRAMLEAMQIGIPIISSKFTGSSEYFSTSDPVIQIDDDFETQLPNFLNKFNNYSADEISFNYFKENTPEKILLEYDDLIQSIMPIY